MQRSHADLSFGDRQPAAAKPTCNRRTRFLVFATLRWDGRDDRGDALASGVYFYRLQTGEWAETRRLLLLR